MQTFKTGRQTQEYLDTKKIPGRYGPDLSEIDVGELINYRSTLLKMAREAAGRGEMGNADFYGAIAQGMLQDLSSLKTLHLIALVNFLSHLMMCLHVLLLKRHLLLVT